MPYSPHTQGSGYNFHGSMNKYRFIKGSKPNTAADRRPELTRALTSAHSPASGP